MVNDTTLLLDLDGVSVIQVERLEGGTRRVHLTTADDSARACPACGVFATRVKGAAFTRPRDLPYGERGLEFLWHKRRWWCREPACPRKSFTEQIPAGARLTTRLRAAAGYRVRDAGTSRVTPHSSPLSCLRQQASAPRRPGGRSGSPDQRRPCVRRR